MRSFVSLGLVLGAGVLVGLCLVSPAAAGLKSGKVSAALTNPANVPAVFTNGVSKGSFSFKGTKLSIKAKGTSAADTDGVHCTSDDVICLIHVTAALSIGTPAEYMAVTMGEVSGGTIKAGHDLCKQRDGGIAPEAYFFCPEFFGVFAPIAVSEVEATCYAAEPTWVAAHAPGVPMSLTGHSCEGVVSAVPLTLPATPLFSSGATLTFP